MYLDGFRAFKAMGLYRRTQRVIIAAILLPNCIRRNKQAEGFLRKLQKLANKVDIAKTRRVKQIPPLSCNLAWENPWRGLCIDYVEVARA
jgi:hypothetical protein